MSLLARTEPDRGKSAGVATRARHGTSGLRAYLACTQCIDPAKSTRKASTRSLPRHRWRRHVIPCGDTKRPIFDMRVVWTPPSASAPASDGSGRSRRPWQRQSAGRGRRSRARRAAETGLKSNLRSRRLAQIRLGRRPGGQQRNSAVRVVPGPGPCAGCGLKLNLLAILR